MILLTRPYADSLVLSNFLKEQGFTTLIEPILNLMETGQEENFIVPKNACLIVTSAFAVQILAKYLTDFFLPLYCVGKATASQALKLGFKHVHSGPGTAERLLIDIFTHESSNLTASLSKHQWIYFSGQDITYDLAAALQAKGFFAERRIIYKACLKKQFDPQTVQAFKQSQIKSVIFFSRRTVKGFLSLAANNALIPSLAQVWAVGISQAVAQALSETRWKKIVVSHSTERGNLLNCLKQMP